MKNNIEKQGSYGIVSSVPELKCEELNLDLDKDYVIKNITKEDFIFGIAPLKEIDILVKGSVHPNIVKLIHIDYGMESLGTDPAKLIFERADFDLREKILSTQQYSPAQKKIIMLDLLSAMKYLHSIKIIHRDIKPENILLYETKEGKTINIQAKLCDFGMSTFFESSNEFSPKKTTYMYSPPEVLLGKTDYDYGIDIWSLGCVFYELISGHTYLPYQKEAKSEIPFFLHWIFYKSETLLDKEILNQIFGEEEISIIKFGETAKQWYSNDRSSKVPQKLKLETFFNFTSSAIYKIEHNKINE